MSFTLIPSIIGSGIQSALARYMAEKSDEGQDARTTYFFLAGIFSPVFFWPLISVLAVSLSDLTLLSISGIFVAAGIIFSFYISSLIFLLGYDLWSDYATARVRAKLSESEDGTRFELLMKNLNSQLGLLI
jgi:hypothetical protein